MKPNTIKDITDFIFLGKDFEELSHYDLLIINADWAEEQLAKDMKLMLDKNIIDNNKNNIQNGYNYVIIIRKEILSLSYQEKEQELINLFKKIGEKNEKQKN